MSFLSSIIGGVSSFANSASSAISGQLSQAGQSAISTASQTASANRAAGEMDEASMRSKMLASKEAEINLSMKSYEFAKQLSAK